MSAQAYPALFVTTGLWDSQVQYYEPTKWVAKPARDPDRQEAPALSRQHGGRPWRQSRDRFQRYRDQAEYLAFTMSQLGITQ